MPRISNEITVTIANGAALSNEFDMGEFASGLIIFPSGWTQADCGAYVAGDLANTTFVPLKDSANAFGETVSVDAVDTSAGSARPIPDWWFGARKVKLFSHNGSGVAVNQVGAKTITIKLKD